MDNSGCLTPARDHHACGPEEPVSPQVTALVECNHRTVFEVRADCDPHRLGALGIEPLAERTDLLHALGLQHLLELTPGELHPFVKLGRRVALCAAAPLLVGPQTALQGIADVEQRAVVVLEGGWPRQRAPDLVELNAPRTPGAEV